MIDNKKPGCYNKHIKPVIQVLTVSEGEHMNSKLLTDEVYNILLNKITEKEWKVGDKLPSENKLCEQFHVSRISIRTAIQKLQAQNLVVTKPGKGSFVSSNHIGENMISFSIEKMNITSNEYHGMLWSYPAGD